MKFTITLFDGTVFAHRYDSFAAAQDGVYAFVGGREFSWRYTAAGEPGDVKCPVWAVRDLEDADPDRREFAWFARIDEVRS